MSNSCREGARCANCMETTSSGRDPQGVMRAQAAATATPSTDGNQSSRPVSLYAYQDAVWALEELGHHDLAHELRHRWQDVPV